MPRNEPNYSEQTQEILGKLPSAVLRWGMTVIFLIFTGILIGSCLIQYPQIVTAPITITTVNPPSDLIAKSTGRIDSIFLHDGTFTNIGDNVALLYNTAVYDDVRIVTREIETFNIDSTAHNGWIDRAYQMGELQSTYSEFRQQYLDYRHYITAENIPQKKVLLAAQIAKHRKYIQQLRVQKSLIREDLGYTQTGFERDSALHAQKIISTLELERSAQAKLQKRNTLAGFDASLTSTELTVLQMEQQLFELEMQHDNEIAAYKRQIAESAGKLSAQIRQWQQSYLLVATTVGRLSFVKYWSRNQNVQTGEKVATIVPPDSARVIGIMTVPSAGFGRVEVGQRVNVKLNGYPYYEYGLLKGVVTRLSSVPEASSIQGQAGGYIAEISFPDGLQSSYSEQIRLIQQMDGTADIITRDQRLIQSLIQPLRALFDKISN